MKAQEATLQGILHTGNQYVIPVFQRFYSWKKDDWQRLWDSVLELKEDADTSKGHFMGALVFVAEMPLPNKMPAYQVIDGQQRLTTLSLLLCALRNVAKESGADALSREITDTYLTHPYNQGRESFRVFPRQRDRDSYTRLVHGEPPTDSDLTGLAVQFFMAQIKELPDAGKEETLRGLFHLLRARLDFVHITLQKENPYQIFKSLNSMGVALSEADLIRNFVFMHVSGEEQDRFDDAQWKPLENKFESATGVFDANKLSTFFRDYLSSDGNYVKQDAIFSSFEAKFNDPALDIFALTKKLDESATYHRFITGATTHPNAEVQAALEQLRELDATVTYPLILRLMILNASGTLSNTDVTQAVQLVSGFVFRRFVCNASSRGYARMFVSACNVLQTDPVNELRAFLQGKDFPSDSRFEQEIAGFRLYTSRYCSAVLKRLERSFAHREQADLSQTQIEHIMPQTLTADWEKELGADYASVHETRLHTIGNLTLTAYNQELGNRSFTDKCNGFADFTGYKNSNIVMTRDVANQSQWTESEIRTRAEMLSQRAVTIWQGA